MRGTIVWTVGLLGAGLVYAQVRDRVINVLNYDVVKMDEPALRLTHVVPAVVLFIPFLIALLRRTSRSSSNPSAPLDERSSGLRMSATMAGVPLLLPVIAAGLWAMGVAPNFVSISIAILGFCWSIERLGRGVSFGDAGTILDRWAPMVLAIALVASTVWHTLGQINFWQHFLLGYADFGLFTTELEHCLPWKDVGSARFADTRMGYHCVPMFYLLAPVYAIFRSPIFLMVVGTFVLNLAAAAFFQLARDRTGSGMVGLLVGLAWLALPSISRLPYTNTYGFQSIFLAVPWLAWTFCLAMRGRWRASHWCLVGAMLCEETVCGVALGWGIYLILWGGRRRAGLWIAAISIAYLLLATAIVIPAFQGSGEYTRLMLFGDLTPGAVIDRLARTRVPLYLLALAGPMLVALMRSGRILIVVLPTLILILLMHQTDYLNIKYWHHTSLLPVLFVAATMGVTKMRGANGDGATKRRGASVGAPLGLLVSVLLFHFFMGSSPFAQSQRVYAANRFLQNPDARIAVVDWVHARFPQEGTTVIATERMAAHFTDYRMVHPAPGVRLADTTDSPHVLIIDRSDLWDKIGMEHTTDETLAQAASAGFVVVREYGPVLVLANDQARGSAFSQGVDR